MVVVSMTVVRDDGEFSNVFFNGSPYVGLIAVSGYVFREIVGEESRVNVFVAFSFVG